MTFDTATGGPNDYLRGDQPCETLSSEQNGFLKLCAKKLLPVLTVYSTIRSRRGSCLLLRSDEFRPQTNFHTTTHLSLLARDRLSANVTASVSKASPAPAHPNAIALRLWYVISEPPSMSPDRSAYIDQRQVQGDAATIHHESAFHIHLAPRTASGSQKDIRQGRCHLRNQT